MGSEYVAGISYYADMLQTAVFKMKKSGPVLFHLSEEKTDVHEGVWFLRDVLRPRVRLMKKISALSVGLDNRSVLYHSFPVEESLDRTARDEQIDWELSHYIGDYERDEFVRDVHVLAPGEDDPTTNLMVVAANRTFVRNIQSLVREKGLGLQVIDTNFFSTWYSLSVNYPETGLRRVLLATVETDRVDAGIFRKGKLSVYRGMAVENSDRVIGMLTEMTEAERPDEVYCAGPGISHGLVNAAGQRLGVTATMLDPVRTLRCRRRYLRGNAFAGDEHRFAAAIGCALRKR